VARGNPSTAHKRQLERKKSEKREAKAREKEDRRRRLDDERARVAAEGGDPDLIGIVAGPQPTDDPDDEDGEDAEDDEEGS
jgi:hypothetical protein